MLSESFQNRTRSGFDTLTMLKIQKLLMTTDRCRQKMGRLRTKEWQEKGNAYS
jgi:hypothetical protein